MGLLEQLLAKIESLETRLTEVLNSGIVTGTTETVATSETPTPALTTAPTVDEAAVADLELDAEGLPWDERINSGNKSDNPHAKTTKGVWKARRGVSPAVISEVKAELRAATPSTTTNAEVAPEAPKAPTAPVAPTAPSAPKAPTAPTAPKAPESTAKQNIINEINELTNTYKVPHGSVVESILKPRGVDTLDTLPEAVHQEVAVQLKGWADYLELCQTLVDNCEELDTKYPDPFHDVLGGTVAWCQQYNPDATHIGDVPHASISQLYDSLNKHYTEWSAFLTQQG